MDLQLKNRIVLITGGSLGIGLAVAKEFVANGARVIICGRDEQKLSEAKESILKTDKNAEIDTVACDVSKYDDLERMTKYIDETYHGLDILINNAGTGSEEKSMTAPDDKWYYYWDLHVMAAIRLTRLCVPLMRKREGEGVILQTSSICATQPLGYEPIYNVTKAALTMYSKCLAEELIGENIRVNSIAPGLVLTPDWHKTAGILSKEKGITPDEFFAGIAEDMAPINRFAQPEEIAKTFVFLCSPVSSYIVGSNVHIDGGALKTIN
ncbi:MAG: SDR family NAD(P)-dependent oxidoreductase [Sphaerochaetaceae bacterium]|nr:SDR family NAD(P)-dependent oxidoreductase [Sphaerochaetaceae bacterium]